MGGWGKSLITDGPSLSHVFAQGTFQLPGECDGIFGGNRCDVLEVPWMGRTVVHISAASGWEKGKMEQLRLV